MGKERIKHKVLIKKVELVKQKTNELEVELTGKLANQDEKHQKDITDLKVKTQQLEEEGINLRYDGTATMTKVPVAAVVEPASAVANNKKLKMMEQLELEFDQKLATQCAQSKKEMAQQLGQFRLEFRMQMAEQNAQRQKEMAQQMIQLKLYSNSTSTGQTPPQQWPDQEATDIEQQMEQLKADFELQLYNQNAQHKKEIENMKVEFSLQLEKQNAQRKKEIAQQLKQFKADVAQQIKQLKTDYENKSICQCQNVKNDIESEIETLKAMIRTEQQQQENQNIPTNKLYKPNGLVRREEFPPLPPITVKSPSDVQLLQHARSKNLSKVRCTVCYQGGNCGRLNCPGAW